MENSAKSLFVCEEWSGCDSRSCENSSKSPHSCFISLAPTLHLFFNGRSFFPLFSLLYASIAELAQSTLLVLLLFCALPLFSAFPQNVRSSSVDAGNTELSRIDTSSSSGYKNVAYFVNWYAFSRIFTSQPVQHTHHATGPSTAAIFNPRILPPTF